MRSALICVFFTLVVQRDGSITVNAEHEEDFRPTPIPLSGWPRDRLEAAGTLQEIIKTEAPPVTAAVPAHYWEDALRHSVYLTLVRDKIDQLIAQGDYISPDSKPNLVAKEIDDHDLWDKIKTARFDRLKEEPIPPADVTILARGRLLEDEQGYRFIEDDTSQNNCSDSDCAKGVKAIWSVKRMRQGETSAGKYHYELTFSVTSQTTKKVKKPYENPVRTFTIKESTPTTERQIVRSREKIILRQDTKPQGAIWVHKNINPVPNYHLKRPATFTRSLDRIFSSLFSDEDSYEEGYRHKPRTYFSNGYPQHAKVSHVDDREPYHQKKLLPYPMAKPQPHRYTYPPIAPPPAPYIQHPYFNVDPLGNIPYVQPYSDNRFLPSNVIKTTRPAVLPTPITNHPLLKESTIEVPIKTKLNATEYTTKEPDVVTTYKIYHHQKQTPMKISYVSDHIRPPVYNAPPGVFVTMDKKPFKPMPPLKYSHSNKPQKAAPPDFRPSPQVIDTQFSEMDSSADTAFRPVTMNFTDIDFKDDDISVKKNNKNTRKPAANKKPAKKHENIKSTRLTTLTPEIITATSLEFENNDDNEMEWANILGAFTKTTPMASHKETTTKEIIDPISSTTPVTTTRKESSTSIEFGDSYEEEITSTSTTTSTTSTTTPKPKKRTRPPPKFNKTEKFKKHKRVTSTTTTTLKPTRKYPLKKPTYDLTPQASSAATSATNSIWETKTHKALASTTTTSSTTPRPTMTIKLTTTSTSSTTSSTTVDTEQPVVTTQPKSKNRFRQSTLMQKGTSVNHDKWSSSTLDKNRTNTGTSHVYAPRRKASKFTGYIPASTPRSPEVQRDREDHRDHAFTSNKASPSSSTTEKTEEDIFVKTTQPTYEKKEIKDDHMSEWSHDDDESEQEESSEMESEPGENSTAQESKDDHEYIFPTASVIQEVKEYIGLEEPVSTTELTVVASPYSATKNKTKCKKKKHNNLTTTEGPFRSSTEAAETVKPETSSTTSTTASPVTPDIFNELFGGFTMDDTTEAAIGQHSTPAPDQNPSGSEKHKRYLHLGDADDLEDFLHSLDEKSNHHTNEEENDDHTNDEKSNHDKTDDKFDEEYDDEKEGSPYNIREDSKELDDDYYEDGQENQNEPFSLLELMDME